MSYKIYLIENTVKITKKCARALFEFAEMTGEFYCSDTPISKDGMLQFDSDAEDHIDILRDTDVVDILSKHKAKGFCIFACLGDGSEKYGDWWKHEFDGSGGYKRLIGRVCVEWESVK